MSFFSGRKTRLGLLAVFGLLALALLASGLRDVSFRPGQIMGEREAQTVSSPVTRIVQDFAGIPIWKQLLAWAIVCLIVLIVSTILSPDLRRKLIRTFLRFMLILAGIYFLARNYGYIFQRLGIGLGQVGNAPPAPADAPPPPVFEAPHISPLAGFLISLGVALVMALIALAVRRWWLRQAARLAARRSMDDLAGIARESLDELLLGAAWDDVIVESYVRMATVVEKRRGLVRHEAMTPREFAVRLTAAGLPADAVHTLTRLFESVRYGTRKSTTTEKDEAVHCLTAILNSCGETA